MKNYKVSVEGCHDGVIALLLLLPGNSLAMITLINSPPTTTELSICTSIIT